MKSFMFVFLGLVLICSTAIAQVDSIIFSGQLLDSESNRGIDFVNIGIKGTSVGCISGAEGQFKLPIDLASYKDSVVSISAIGYSPKSYEVASIKSGIENIIVLEPAVYELESIDILSHYPKLKRYGANRGGDGLIKGMLHGLEKAYLIPVKEKAIKVVNLRFCLRSEFDTVKFRVNFYEKEDNAPGRRLNQVSLVFDRVSDEDGWVECSLSDQQCIYNSDFYIAVELLPEADENEVINSKFKAKISGKGQLFTRDYLDTWQEIKGLAVLLNVDYYRTL